MYKITCTYDSDLTTRKMWQFADALEAFNSFEKFTDLGFANEYSTVNLEMPNGKMYTKIFYREGRKVVTK